MSTQTHVWLLGCSSWLEEYRRSGELELGGLGTAVVVVVFVSIYRNFSISTPVRQSGQALQDP
jgi:hypothetical protein